MSSLAAFRLLENSRQVRVRQSAETEILDKHKIEFDICVSSGVCCLSLNKFFLILYPAEAANRTDVTFSQLKDPDPEFTGPSGVGLTY